MSRKKKKKEAKVKGISKNVIAGNVETRRIPKALILDMPRGISQAPFQEMINEWRQTMNAPMMTMGQVQDFINTSKMKVNQHQTNQTDSSLMQKDTPPKSQQQTTKSIDKRPNNRGRPKKDKPPQIKRGQGTGYRSKVIAKRKDGQVVIVQKGTSNDEVKQIFEEQAKIERENRTIPIWRQEQFYCLDFGIWKMLPTQHFWNPSNVTCRAWLWCEDCDERVEAIPNLVYDRTNIAWFCPQCRRLIRLTKCYENSWMVRQELEKRKLGITDEEDEYLEEQQETQNKEKQETELTEEHFKSIAELLDEHLEEQDDDELKKLFEFDKE
jgi:hypothetical protein